MMPRAKGQGRRTRAADDGYRDVDASIIDMKNVGIDAAAIQANPWILLLSERVHDEAGGSADATKTVQGGQDASDAKKEAGAGDGAVPADNGGKAGTAAKQPLRLRLAQLGQSPSKANPCIVNVMDVDMDDDRPELKSAADRILGARSGIMRREIAGNEILSFIQTVGKAGGVFDIAADSLSNLYYTHIIVK